ncbi:DMT family transporter [Microbaculum marinum]|uniref:DMT family transporter n=1 Tax=Microbaculum marinum TaxID=1764581 RepID=A0AAW9RSE5_9HYPH
MSEQTRAYVILAFMPLFFSSNLVLGRAALDMLEPWTLAFWRWGLASAFLLPFAWIGLRTHRVALLAQWKMIVLLGFLGMVICGGLVYVSLRFTTATHGTLIYTTSPVFVLILEVVFRGQRVSLRQASGVLLAFLGVAIIVMHGQLQRLLDFELNPGDIGMMFAAFCWAVYSVLLRRSALNVFPTRTLFAAIAATGVILLLPIMLWETVAVAHVPASAPAWVSMVSLAVFSSLLPFLSYQYGVKIVGPSVTSVFLYMLPAYGVVMAVLFLGEEFHIYHAVGFVTVTAGVVLATAQFGRRHARARPA